MSLANLPNDCLLACLARVPYADLRNAIPSTSKQLRDAVASPAFRKTRELAGCVEYGVFATPWQADRICYLITKLGARRTAPRPPNQQGVWAIGLQDKVVVVNHNADCLFDAHAYDVSEDKWRGIAPLVRDGDPHIDYNAVVGNIGRNFVVLGGGSDQSYDPFMRRMDAYDPDQDTWSRLPDLPFHSGTNKVVEVDGKLWCFGGTFGPHEAEEDEPLDRLATFIYDPATRTWTNGPRLPHEMTERITEYTGFEFQKQFCLMGAEILDDDRYSSVAFLWDPTRETWDPFPVPPVLACSISQTNDHVVVHGFFAPVDQIAEMRVTTPRLFVLGPGKHWTEWDIPAELRRIEDRIAAVRLG